MVDASYTKEWITLPVFSPIYQSSINVYIPYAFFAYRM